MYNIINSIPGYTWSPLLLLMVVLAWRRSKTTCMVKRPPTPGLALPIIGHLHLMSHNPRVQFAIWAKRLGPIFRLQFGSRTVIVLNGYDVLKSAFVRKAEYFSDRPKTFLGDVMARNSGFVSNCPYWRKLRKITVDILREFGFGTNEMEGRIQMEVNQFIEAIHESNGKPLNVRDPLERGMNNVIARLVFGDDFSPDDSNIAQCVMMIGDQVSLIEGAVVLNFLPFLRVLPGDLFGLAKASKIADDLDAVLAREIEIRRQKLKEDKAGGHDFITVFLQKMEDDREQDNVGNNESCAMMDEKTLIGVLKSLFGAGTETTTSTTCWAVLYLLHHPDVLNRCYKEIDEVIGTNRAPSLQDRSECKYLEATIMETQRLSSISPFSVYHTASADVQLNGFVIPQGSIVMPSLDSVLHSRKIWGDPKNFRPERFLDEATGQIIRREELVPFSLGKRACLGESLAKQEMFLFLATLIQQFDFKLPEGSNLPSLDYRFGLNCSSLPYKICFVPR